MPRTGYFIAVAVAIIAAFAFTGGAGASHQGAPTDPYFTCQASVARATLLNGNPIPPVDPLGANLGVEPCAEDLGGLPDIALPPGTGTPVVATETGQAETRIVCTPQTSVPAGKDPAEFCDAGRPTYEQQVESTADVTDTRITLGGIVITVQAANTSATARCHPTDNVPVLVSSSQVVGLSIAGTNVPIPVITGQPNQTIVIPGVLRITLNELIGAEGQYPETATEGRVTRRAVHVEVVPGAQGVGQVADVVIAESTADFHGDVCPEGRLVVRKQTAPDEEPATTAFGFTAGPGLNSGSSDFDLRDDEERVLQGSAASISPDEVLPGTYTVTEDAPTGNYILTGIDCAENRTEAGSTTNVANRTATVKVDPGETVTCTFVNARQPTCPDGSLPVNGTCPGAVTCPGGITPVNGTCPGTVTCPGGITPVNGTCPGTLTCPGGVTPVNGTCPGTVSCPFGITPTNGQCLVRDVQCPAGTTFNPVTRGCSEAPRGGTLVPLTIPALQNFFRASPCIGQGFGALLGIIGTNGPDRITGTNISDRIFALGGNDRVSGGRGDDCVEGGSGRDVLDGSNGNDVLLGGTEGDQIVGGPGRDRLSGGSGRDGMSGASGNDVMNGGGGRDRMNGGFGNDRLFGGPGNDGIHTGNGKDFVSAGSGNDIVNAATRAPAAFVDCGPGRKDRVRINKNERNRIRNCEFVDITTRIRGR